MRIVVDLSAVVVTVTGDIPRVLVVERDGVDALPEGELDPDHDRTLDRGVRRWAAERTGLELGFVEQLYTFGDVRRDPAASGRGERRVTVAYVAFVRETGAVRAEAARWRDVYAFFPWEDRRGGQSSVVEEVIVPGLDVWVDGAPDADGRAERRERADVTFGLAGARWDPVRSLERYELLFEAGLVAEAHRPAPAAASTPVCGPGGVIGREAALDHRRILASALGRLRGKLTYRPVVFELLPPLFTLLQLQHVVEALAGVELHKQNFRRLVEDGGLVEGTGRAATSGRGRPAELFRFRREVVRERPTPGVGLPGRR